jgi:class 3 adenylate cyclase
LTLLFTEVEGSSRLREEQPDVMSGWLIRHDEIIRLSVAEHGGAVLSTAGDSLVVACDSAVEEAAAATEVQRRLAEDQGDGLRRLSGWEL